MYSWENVKFPYVYQENDSINLQEVLNIGVVLKIQIVDSK